MKKSLFRTTVLAFLAVFALSSCKGLFNSGITVEPEVLDPEKPVFVGFSSLNMQRNAVPIPRSEIMCYELEVYDQDNKYLKTIDTPFEFTDEQILVILEAYKKIYGDEVSEEELRKGLVNNYYESLIYAPNQIILEIAPGIYNFVLNAYKLKDGKKDNLLMTGKSGAVKIQPSNLSPVDLLMAMGGVEVEERFSELNLIKIDLKVVEVEGAKGLIRFLTNCEYLKKDTADVEIRYTTRQDYVKNGNNANWISSLTDDSIKTYLLTEAEYEEKNQEYYASCYGEGYGKDKDYEERLFDYGKDYPETFVYAEIPNLSTQKYYVQAIITQKINDQEYKLYAGDVVEVISGFTTDCRKFIQANPEYKKIKFDFMCEETDTVYWSAPNHDFYNNNPGEIKVYNNGNNEFGVPSRAGYTFTGWATKDEKDELVETDKVLWLQYTMDGIETYTHYDNSYTTAKLDFENTEEGTIFYAMWEKNEDEEEILPSVFNFRFCFGTASGENFRWKEPKANEENDVDYPDADFNFYTNEKIAIYIPKRDGYIFKGWSDTEDFANQSEIIYWEKRDGTKSYEYNAADDLTYAFIDMSKVKTSPTFYAVWEKAITVYFDFSSAIDATDINIGVNWDCLEGLTNYSSIVTVSLAGNKTITMNKPEKEGFSFQGWGEKENDVISPTTQFTWSDVENTEISMRTFTDGTTFYPIWKKVLYMNLQAADADWQSPNDDQVIPAHTNIVELESSLDAMVSLNEPSRQNYQFAGWKTKIGGVLSDNAPEEIQNSKLNVSLAAPGEMYYATWKKKINFDLNPSDTISVSWDGSTYNFEMSGTFKWYDSTSTVTLPVPEKEGYEFYGWYKYSTYDNSYEEVAYISGNSLNVEAAPTGVLLKPKWAKTIKFNLQIPITKDVNNPITVSWLRPDDNTLHDYTHDSNFDESEVSVQIIADNASLEIPNPTIIMNSQDYATFEGWSSSVGSNGLYTNITTNGTKRSLNMDDYTSDDTLYAVWCKYVSFELPDISSTNQYSWRGPGEDARQDYSENPEPIPLYPWDSYDFSVPVDKSAKKYFTGWYTDSTYTNAESVLKYIDNDNIETQNALVYKKAILDYESIIGSITLYAQMLNGLNNNSTRTQFIFTDCEDLIQSTEIESKISDIDIEGFYNDSVQSDSIEITKTMLEQCTYYKNDVKLINSIVCVLESVTTSSDNSFTFNFASNLPGMTDSIYLHCYKELYICPFGNNILFEMNKDSVNPILRIGNSGVTSGINDSVYWLKSDSRNLYNLILSGGNCNYNDVQNSTTIDVSSLINKNIEGSDIKHPCGLIQLDSDTLILSSHVYLVNNWNSNTTETVPEGYFGGAISTSIENEGVAQLIIDNSNSDSNPVICNNKSEKGGGIYFATAGLYNVELKNIDILNNIADQYGGGVCYELKTSENDYNGIEINALSIYQANICGNKANYGGGIAIINPTNRQNIELGSQDYGISMKDNVANAAGGGIYIDVVNNNSPSVDILIPLQFNNEAPKDHGAQVYFAAGVYIGESNSINGVDPRNSNKYDTNNDGFLDNVFIVDGNN